MFPEVWRSVVGREFKTVKCSATGFAIYRVQGAVFPGIIAASQQDVVPGVVHLDVDEPSLTRLDLFEDNFYERRSLSIDCSDGVQRSAFAYVVPESNRSVLSCEPWDRSSFLSSGGLEQFIRRFGGFDRVREASNQ
jgi:gamma-glutamylcyclotransferase (GGCT)/AIG2-like uncharacterized protein YtfP